MTTGSDPRRIVREGYDAIGRRYLEWGGEGLSPTRAWFLDLILERLAPPSDVLELGCGPGLPITAALATRHRVTGVDISPGQLALARAHVPDADFVEADMTEVAFSPESFDAVVAFYSLTHVPRAELPALLRRIRTWLRPNCRLFATMGAGDEPGGVEPDWLGVPMFFSHYGAETNRRLVEEAAFEVERAEVVEEDEGEGRLVSFLWLVARRT